ncbi:uncharacterized protein LOC131094977 isoform X1 [Melospiza georgiana]|uniref:uncharacterized protein LOC131094977 isoform X1 n=1 Tax=Melospiza georgiana TaxID=44398 RepID=UPI0025ACEB34|nr:uncharacterized protein LOC131094977 isoform X1 [Melospiza georgiana]
MQPEPGELRPERAGGGVPWCWGCSSSFSCSGLPPLPPAPPPSQPGPGSADTQKQPRSALGGFRNNCPRRGTGSDPGSTGSDPESRGMELGALSLPVPLLLGALGGNWKQTAPGGGCSRRWAEPRWNAWLCKYRSGRALGLVGGSSAGFARLCEGRERLERWRRRPERSRSPAAPWGPSWRHFSMNFSKELRMETREDKSPQQNLMEEAVLRGLTVQEFNGDKKPWRFHMKRGCKPAQEAVRRKDPPCAGKAAGDPDAAWSWWFLSTFMAGRSPTSAWNVGRASGSAPASSPTFACTWLGPPLSRGRFEPEYWESQSQPVPSPTSAGLWEEPKGMEVPNTVMKCLSCSQLWMLLCTDLPWSVPWGAGKRFR